VQLVLARMSGDSRLEWGQRLAQLLDLPGAGGALQLTVSPGRGQGYLVARRAVEAEVPEDEQDGAKQESQPCRVAKLGQNQALQGRARCLLAHGGTILRQFLAGGGSYSTGALLPCPPRSWEGRQRCTGRPCRCYWRLSRSASRTPRCSESSGGSTPRRAGPR